MSRSKRITGSRFHVCEGYHHEGRMRVLLEVEYLYTPGKASAPGERPHTSFMDPDGPSFELVDIRDMGGRSVFTKLSDDQLHEVTSEVLDNIFSN